MLVNVAAGSQAGRRPAAPVASRRRRGEFTRQLPGPEPPGPVSGGRAGHVHPRLAPEPEHVLRLHDRELRARRERRLDQLPVRPGARKAGRDALARAQRPPPAERGIAVVRADVHDAPAPMVLQPVDVGGRPSEGELHHDRPGDAQPIAQRPDLPRDHAEILGDERQRAELLLRDPEEIRPGTAAPAPVLRGPVSLRHGPVGDESAEVVDAGEVNELERVPQALHPPAVAPGAKRAPVVERVAPELADRAQVVRGRTGDEPALEELRMRGDVRAAPRHVDRHIPEQPDATLGRVPPQRGPLAVEANLVGDRARPREGGPVADPVRLAGDKLLELAGRDLRGRALEVPRVPGEGGRGRIRRAGPVRRGERQQRPPRLPGLGEPVDEAERLAAEPAAGQRGHVQEHSARSSNVHTVWAPPFAET